MAELTIPTQSDPEYTPEQAERARIWAEMLARAPLTEWREDPRRANAVWSDPERVNRGFQIKERM